MKILTLKGLKYFKNKITSSVDQKMLNQLKTSRKHKVMEITYNFDTPTPRSKYQNAVFTTQLYRYIDYMFMDDKLFDLDDLIIYGTETSGSLPEYSGGEGNGVCCVSPTMTGIHKITLVLSFSGYPVLYGNGTVGEPSSIASESYITNHYWFSQWSQEMIEGIKLPFMRIIDNKFLERARLKEIHIGAGTEGICNYAFGCVSDVKIHLPHSITRLDWSSFKNSQGYGVNHYEVYWDNTFDFIHNHKIGNGNIDLGGAFAFDTSSQNTFYLKDCTTTKENLYNGIK